MCDCVLGLTVLNDTSYGGLASRRRAIVLSLIPRKWRIPISNKNLSRTEIWKKYGVTIRQLEMILIFMVILLDRRFGVHMSQQIGCDKISGESNCQLPAIRVVNLEIRFIISLKITVRRWIWEISVVNCASEFLRLKAKPFQRISKMSKLIYGHFLSW
jgi:hypothetical protein